MVEIKNSNDYIAVARGSDLVIIRVIGRGNMITAPALADFAEEQRRAGYTRFIFDLERCKGLDSTFIGVMVGMYTSTESGLYHGLHLESDANRALPVIVEAAITAVNVSAELRQLLEMLGADRFVKMGGVCNLKQLEMTALPEKMMPIEDRQRLILKAHDTLVEIDKRNEARFGDFLKMLSKELA